MAAGHIDNNKHHNQLPLLTKQQTTNNKQQTTNNNQQSTINNQQSTISNQYPPTHKK
jgi:hypothetical protein